MPTFNPGTFLARQLEQILPKTYEKRYPRLWAEEGLYVPAVGDLEQGAQTIIEEAVTDIGEAAIYAPGSTDIPYAEVQIAETPYKAVCIVNAFKYGYIEMKRAAKAGKPIDDLRAMAADKVLRQRVHRVACFGSSKHAMTGIYNDANVAVVASSYDADGGAVTAQDHVDFVRDQISKIENDSNLTEDVTTILVPPKVYHIWQSVEMPGSGDSVLKFILDNYGTAVGGMLRNIVKANECRADQLEAYGVKSAGTNEDRLLFISSNPDTIERHFYPKETLPTQLIGMDYCTYQHCGTSEAIVHYPNGMLYVDIPYVP